MNHSLNAPVQRAVRALSELQAAKLEVLSMGDSPSSPLFKQAVMLSHMLGRANDAIKDDFAHIVDGKMPRYELILRDKETGELVDPATGVTLNRLSEIRAARSS